MAICRNRGDFNRRKLHQASSSAREMAAQVQHMPRDYPDNKIKDDNQFGGSAGAVSSSSLPASYNVEVNRLESFKNWHVPFIRKEELARYGFYYVGPSDMVKCYFCRVEIGLWEPNDNVLSEHLRWSPYCPLLRRRQTDNVAIDERFLDALPEASYDTCGIRLRENSVAENAFPASSVSSSERHSDSSLASSLSMSPPNLPPSPMDQTIGSPFPHHHQQHYQHEATAAIPHARLPEYPNYAIEAKRLESYEDWPKFMRQKPQELSDAGFFYTGKSDRVKCFSCGGGLKDWEASDDPWEQHAMWYSTCEYLKLMKDEEYIAQCLAKKEALTNATNNPTVPPSSSLPERDILSSPQPSTSGIGSAVTNTPQSSGPVSSRGSSSSSSSSGGSISSNGSDDEGRIGSPRIDDDDDEANKKSDTSRICKICYVNEYNTAFTPCGHVVACAKCASSVTKCPLCRKPFTNVMRIYLM